MSRSDTIVALARAWIGTPYRHQATCRDGGCDCLGFLRGVWRELHGAEPEAVPAYSRDWAEPQGREVLLAAAERWLRPKALREEAPGDVLVFRMRERSIAKHVGIQALTGAATSFVHAYERHGVLESPLSDPWRRRIAARFTFPEETV